MNRTPILLVALLLVLGAIVLFVIPSGNEREASYQQAQISLKVDSASIVKIEIQRPTKSITIENVGGKWTITSPGYYLADPNAVTQVISGLTKFKVGSLISSNTEKQHLFQVDSGGTRLTVTDRLGHATSIIVGKMGPSYSEVYFRMPASKDVYLAEGLDSWTLNKEVKDWRDRTINAVPAETFKEVSYTIGAKQYTFLKDSTGWKSGDTPIETSVMSPFVNTLSNLRADDFADSNVQFRSQPINLQAKGLANTTLNLYPILPDSARYYVQTSATPQTFIVSKWTVQQLLNPIEKFKPTPVSKPSQQPVATVAPTKKAESKVQTTKALPPPIKEEKKIATETSPKEIPRRSEIPRRRKSPRTSEQQPITPVTPETAPTTTEKPSQKQVVSTNKTSPEEEGDLTVHTVKKGETMQTIAQKYHTTVEQILKWNLLKSIAVKPGQELYIYVKK